ncbi:MAG: response regulator transcription factor [Bacteroidia bacterium]
MNIATQKILIVEDDENLAYLLKENMETRGFSVTICADGKQGFRVFNQQAFQLCILDVMLPYKDGFALAKEMRIQNQNIPIIFLTSRSMEIDKIKGFESGCDDYITKPFSVMELLLRVNAVLKRTNVNEVKKEKDIFTFGSCILLFSERKLIFSDKTEKSLSMKEAELLRIFCEKQNELIHRQYLMNRIWGSDDYYIAKSMDVFITRLRKLLKFETDIEIQNIYGTGFKFIVKSAEIK